MPLSEKKKSKKMIAVRRVGVCLPAIDLLAIVSDYYYLFITFFFFISENSLGLCIKQLVFRFAFEFPVA